MGMRRFVTGCAVAAVCAASVALAGDPQAASTPTAEQKAAMEMWQKLATPGEHHTMLEPFVGNWDATVSVWEKPGAAPQVSHGTSECAWVLGGRFVRESFHGEFMGMPFEGMGMTGYDNYKQKYIGTWVDTMGTAMMVSEGTSDAAGKTFTSTSTMDDPTTGKKVTVRGVVNVVDANKHVYSMYSPDPSGKEFKMMEIVYTRK